MTALSIAWLKRAERIVAHQAFTLRSRNQRWKLNRLAGFHVPKEHARVLVLWIHSEKEVRQAQVQHERVNLLPRCHAARFSERQSTTHDAQMMEDFRDGRASVWIFNCSKPREATT